MLNLTRKNFEKIKKLLVRRQKEVEQELKSIEIEDPVMDPSIAESSEPGTDSWLAETHGRAVAMKRSLLDLLNRTKKALANIRSGSYGKCESCGKMIEAERLEVIPTAALCLSCSKKGTKRSK